jgi:glycine/D-amino acid oxidase-like deaminating enzyme
MDFSRRKFLKTAAGTSLFFGVSAGAGQELHSARPAEANKKNFPSTKPDVAVIGAGAFGLWTALYLNRLGANVTVIDMYGPGNSRSSSGDETRGIKSSWGSRTHGLQWAAWAREATDRWTRWDSEWRDKQHPRLFFQTGDLMLRPQMMRELELTIANWDELGIPYETFDQDEIRRRFPAINVDRFDTAVFEPGAGVIRSRRALEAVAEVFQSEGGAILIDQAAPGPGSSSRLNELKLKSGATVSADRFVFACGPWLPKTLPNIMGHRLRTPMGHVYYFGTPPGDKRFDYPNFPSFNIPGATGWPALSRDNRGFRFRTGGRLLQDPDQSDRSIPRRHIENAREMLAKYLPALAGAPLVETRSAHFEYSIDGNLIVDTPPALENVWIAGGGSAEGYKFGPVIGEYVARRVLDLETDSQLADGFRLKPTEFGEQPPGKEPGWLSTKIDAYCRKRR